MTIETTTTQPIPAPNQGTEDGISKENKKNTFSKQYIDQYLPTINNTLHSLNANHTTLQIPYALFLFTVLDYFSFLFIVATQGRANKRNSSNFITFLTSNYFPGVDSCKANLLQLMRNGVAHQIFPKASGIGYVPKKMLFFEETVNKQLIPVLNIYYFEQVAMDGIKNFIDDIKQNDVYIDNLYSFLCQGNHRYLGDFKELEDCLKKYCGGTFESIYK